MVDTSHPHSTSAPTSGIAAGESVPDPDGPFPGWYPDPLKLADERFWNGREWTGNSRGQHVEDVAPATEPAAPASEPARSASTAVEQEVAASKPRIFGNSPAVGTDLAIDSVPAVDSIVRSPGSPTLARPLPSRGTELTELAKRAAASQAAAAQAQAGSPTTPTASFTPGPAASPPATPTATPTPTPAATPTPTPPMPSVALSEDKALLVQTADVDANPIIRTSVATPATPGPGGSSRLLPAILGSLVALAVGLGIGWFLANSQNSTTDSVSGTTDAVSGTTDAVSATTDAQGTRVPATDGATGSTAAVVPSPVPSADIDELEAMLVESEAAVDALTVARDNEQAHNDLLQTWFTPEVRDRSERNWNAEVDRACSADAPPTIENTNYTRAMELMGTHTDLVNAVAVCKTDG
ncbi:MAG: hypothetical protein ACI8TP_000308 [Acidimicrobiales bacterium]|jgi:hypothetical protein